MNITRSAFSGAACEGSTREGGEHGSEQDCTSGPAGLGPLCRGLHRLPCALVLGPGRCLGQGLWAWSCLLLSLATSGPLQALWAGLPSGSGSRRGPARGTRSQMGGPGHQAERTSNSQYEQRCKAADPLALKHPCSVLLCHCHSQPSCHRLLVIRAGRPDVTAAPSWAAGYKQACCAHAARGLGWLLTSPTSATQFLVKLLVPPPNRVPCCCFDWEICHSPCGVYSLKLCNHQGGKNRETRLLQRAISEQALNYRLPPSRLRTRFNYAPENKGQRVLGRSRFWLPAPLGTSSDFRTLKMPVKMLRDRCCHFQVVA